ncbi:MAG: signal peptide peptidase SppA [Zoogloeaceae bacterium]|nr:signal peptide peptidase SppA [Rhodocyclaceae bacterium]MCP5236798.1 signal peptide peptidase SppA [Zoogloeaceae bacterium]
MSNGEKGILMRLLGGAWAAVNGLRRLVVNVVFLLLLALALGLLLARAPNPVIDGSALLLRPAGQLVEQVAVADPLSLLQRGANPSQTPLHEVLEALDAAASDTRIRGVVIETDPLAAAGLAKLQELAAAITRFREAAPDKPILAWGSRFTQAQYFLASQADEVYLAPDGFVLAHGFASYPTYYKGLFDKLDVRINVFRVGIHKSAVEPFTRESMSEPHREATARLLDGLWAQWLEGVTTHRSIGTDELDALVDDYPARLAAANGDAAQLALQSGLVDGLLTPDQWRALQISRFGRLDDGKSPRRTALGAYLAGVRAQLVPAPARIAVVTVQGAIVDGDSPIGVAGGETVAAMLARVRDDDAYKGLVLRIDSPGGSVFASERIRREVDLIRQAGKPVVASMSSVAASGGYWVALAADEIWAGSSTLTGSIGIFGMFPDLSGLLARGGLAVDGVGTSPIAGGLDPRRPLSEPMASALKSSIEHGYRRFVGLVASARGMDGAAVEKVAQGQVWSGRQALDHGLVDQLGGLGAAIGAAAGRAGLDRYQVDWIEPELDARERILERLLHAFAVDRPDRGIAAGATAVFVQMVGELGDLADWNDPGHVYAHCECQSP